MKPSETRQIQGDYRRESTKKRKEKKMKKKKKERKKERKKEPTNRGRQVLRHQRGAAAFDSAPQKYPNPKYKKK